MLHSRVTDHLSALPLPCAAWHQAHTRMHAMHVHNATGGWEICTPPPVLSFIAMRCCCAARPHRRAPGIAVRATASASTAVSPLAQIDSTWCRSLQGMGTEPHPRVTVLRHANTWCVKAEKAWIWYTDYAYKITTDWVGSCAPKWAR